MRLSGGRMRAGHVAQLGGPGAVCDPAQGPSHVGGPSMLVCSYCQPRHWCHWHWSWCPHPSSQSTQHYAPIRVVRSRQSESIRLPHRQSDSVRVNSSLLHIIKIIKIIFIFNSFTCTGWPDPIDPGHFEFASRNLVGLPIIMPLIDTN